MFSRLRNQIAKKIEKAVGKLSDFVADLITNCGETGLSYIANPAVRTQVDKYVFYPSSKVIYAGLMVIPLTAQHFSNIVLFPMDEKNFLIGYLKQLQLYPTYENAHKEEAGRLQSLPFEMKGEVLSQLSGNMSSINSFMAVSKEFFNVYKSTLLINERLNNSYLHQILDSAIRYGTFRLRMNEVVAEVGTFFAIVNPHTLLILNTCISVFALANRSEMHKYKNKYISLAYLYAIILHPAIYFLIHPTVINLHTHLRHAIALTKKGVDEHVKKVIHKRYDSEVSYALSYFSIFKKPPDQEILNNLARYDIVLTPKGKERHLDEDGKLKY